jgi:hypothetical protein
MNYYNIQYSPIKSEIINYKSKINKSNKLNNFNQRINIKKKIIIYGSRILLNFN